MNDIRFQITIESNTDVRNDIFFDLKKDYPDTVIEGGEGSVSKTTWDAPTITLVSIDSGLLIVGIIGLVKSFIDTHGYKDKKKNIIKLTDRKNGKEAIIPTDKSIDPTSIINDFLNDKSSK